MDHGGLLLARESEIPCPLYSKTKMFLDLNCVCNLCFVNLCVFYFVKQYVMWTLPWRIGQCETGWWCQSLEAHTITLMLLA